MPKVSGAPKELNNILESAYASAMKKYGDKEKASKIAWGAAKKAGWHKVGDSWTKGKNSEFIFSDKIEIKSREEEGEEQFFISGIVSSSNKDLGNDIVTKNALLQLVDTLNTKNIKLGYDHTEVLGGKPTTVPIGTAVKGAAKIIDETKAFAEFKLNKHLSVFPEFKGSVQDGHLDAFSVEYIVESAEPEIATKTTPRVIHSWNVVGVGSTGRPMNQDAVLTNFYAKSLSEAEQQLINDIETKSIEVKIMAKDKEKEKDDDAEEKEEKSDKIVKTETKAEDPELKEFREYKTNKEIEAKKADFKKAVEEEVKEQLKNIKPATMPVEGTELKSMQSVELKNFQEVIKEKPKEVKNSAWIAMQYKHAADLHNSLDKQGIDIFKTSFFNSSSPSFECKGLEKGYDSSMRRIEVKNNPFIETKAAAPLEHDTNKVTTGTTYFQAAPHIRDIYDPVIQNHLNDETTFYGILKKVDGSSFGDRYGFVINYDRVKYSGGTAAAGPYDESTDLSAYAGKSAMLKCQIPFMWYYNIVEVTNQAATSARNSKGIGDLFANQVERATADLLKKINQDLFYDGATRLGMTAGSNILSLPSLVDDAAAPFGDTNKYGHAMATYTTLKGGLVTSESGTPDLTIDKIRIDYHTVIENGARKGDLVFVTSFNQLRKILEIADEKQRILGTSAVQGFEGATTVDGIPVFADTDCSDGYFYTVDLANTFIAVQLAPTLTDLYLNKDSKGAYIKYYFAFVGTRPLNNALRYGLATS